MSITDPVNSIYMNNMYVTGGNGAVGNIAYTNGVNTNNTQQTGSTTGALKESFTDMLTGMMNMNMAGSLASIGDFSDTGSSTDYSSGLMGLGSGMDSLMGSSSSSEMSMMMMLIMMMLLEKNDSGQNNNLLSSLTQQNAQPAYAQQCAHAYSANTGIPTNSASVANAAITNNIGERDAVAYRTVIDQFQVETNRRYAVNKQGINDTYCNIFVWDVTRAMGAEIPHYTDKVTGAPLASASGGNAQEMNANQVNTWLNTHGKQYGWVQVSAEEAQYYANMGMPAVTSWKNPAGHGHLQVVSPSVDGAYDAGRGVAIAQAGRQLKNYDYITSVYGSATLPHVEYYVHV